VALSKKEKKPPHDVIHDIVTFYCSTHSMFNYPCSCVWDLETGKRSIELYGHAGDVVTLSLKPEDENIFITGSVDQTAKLWDLREKAACQTFWGHSADVNSVFVRKNIFYDRNII